MIEEIHFILHVANGIYIIHNVIWYNYKNTYTNNSIIILIIVQISTYSDTNKSIFIHFRKHHHRKDLFKSFYMIYYTLI